MTETETTERHYGDLNPGNLRVVCLAAVVIATVLLVGAFWYGAEDSKNDSQVEQKGYEACAAHDFDRDSEMLECIDEVR